MRKLAAWMLAAAVAGPAYAGGADDGLTGNGAPLDARESAAALAAVPSAPLLPAVEGATDASGGSSIVTSALWGGLAGAVVGTGVALIENGNWGRDIAIGAGVGLLAGGALGALNVFGDTNRPFSDGLRSPDRDPVLTARTVALGGRF